MIKEFKADLDEYGRELGQELEKFFLKRNTLILDLRARGCCADRLDGRDLGLSGEVKVNLR